MSTVIAFPRPEASATGKPRRRRGSTTLFIHVQRATFIAYLAGRPRTPGRETDRATHR